LAQASSPPGLQRASGAPRGRATPSRNWAGGRVGATGSMDDDFIADYGGETTENDSLVSGRSNGSRAPSRPPEAGFAGFAAKLWALMPEAVRGIRMELVQGAVVRLYYSKFTAFLYLATLLLAGVLLAITLGLDTPLRDSPAMFSVLEGVVTMSLFTEVLLRLVVLGRDYLNSWSNVLDLVVALASGSLFFWAAPRASKAEDFERQKEDVELSQSLVMARTLVQFGRVLLIAEHARRSRQSKHSDDLDFSSLGDGSGLDIDLDFSVLREQKLQVRSRNEEIDGL